MIMKKRRILTAAFGSAALGIVAMGCASAGPSEQLIDARRAYEEARSSNANTLVPAQMLEAKQALQRAERVHAEAPASAAEKHYAYLAEREAEMAMAKGNLVAAQQSHQTADRAYTQAQEDLRIRAQEELLRTRQALEQTRTEMNSIALQMEQRNDKVEELEQKRADLQRKAQDLTSRQGELEKALQIETKARIAAQEQAKAALASLNDLARIKEEANETVITLSGSVLFTTGQATLMPIAQNSLDRVAEALKAQGEEKKIVIEGHTDSRGSDVTNQQLSLARASAVREYLVGRGIKADRVEAVGSGESEPIADNATPEGRANNRRVEIIVKNQ